MKTLSNRRNFLFAIPALAAAPATGQINSKVTDLHPAWMDHWRVNRARWMELAYLPHNGNFDDPRSIECEKVQTEMERRLASVPATTLAGAVACLAWIEEEMDAEEWAFKGHKEAFDNAMRALRAIEANRTRS